MPWRLIFRLGRAACAIYAGSLVFVSMQDPLAFARFAARSERQGLYGRFPRRLLRLLPAVLGVAALIYSASFAITAAIPSGWHDIDDDGDDHGSTRMAFTWLLTVIGTLIAYSKWDELISDTLQEQDAKRGRLSG